MEFVHPTWLVNVADSSVFGVFEWLSDRAPWEVRVLSFIALSVVGLPFAMWVWELRNRRTQRKRGEWKAPNRALDLAAPDSVDEHSEDEESAHLRENNQQIRKRIRRTEEVNRNEHSEPPLD